VMSLFVPITQKPHGRSSPNFLCMLPLAMARFSSDGVVICYILPVLRMTLCFHSTGQWATITHSYISVKFARWQHKLDVRRPVFDRILENAAPGRSLLSMIVLLLLLLVVEHGSFYTTEDM